LETLLTLSSTASIAQPGRVASAPPNTSQIGSLAYLLAASGQMGGNAFASQFDKINKVANNGLSSRFNSMFPVDQYRAPNIQHPAYRSKASVYNLPDGHSLMSDLGGSSAIMGNHNQDRPIPRQPQMHPASAGSVFAGPRRVIAGPDSPTHPNIPKAASSGPKRVVAGPDPPVTSRVTMAAPTGLYQVAAGSDVSTPRDPMAEYVKHLRESENCRPAIVLAPGKVLPPLPAWARRHRHTRKPTARGQTSAQSRWHRHPRLPAAR
jgi:hypothetical protein